MRRYKGARSILELLFAGVDTKDDLLHAVRKNEMGMLRAEAGHGHKKISKAEEEQIANRYYSIVYKLKRDGLISEQGDGKDGKYILTGKGNKKLEGLRSRGELPMVHYKKEKGSRVIIVMFDIPEEHTRMRRWLRVVLKNLDFKLAQKSVWIGKTKIPGELIADLTHMGLDEFVEIFEVGSTGNLKHLI